MWAKYHCSEAEMRLREGLIALTRISRIRMRHRFADWLIKEKYNFQVVTARVSRFVALCVIILCTSLFFFVSVPLNQTESHWRWWQQVRLKRQNKPTAIHDIKTHKTDISFQYILNRIDAFCLLHSTFIAHDFPVQGTSVLFSSERRGQVVSIPLCYVVGSRFKCLTKERIFWLRHLQTFVSRSGKIRELILH